MIAAERDGDVMVVKLNRGVTNPISLELACELGEAATEAKADPAVRGLVLTSTSDKFFCIGFDIPALIDLDREAFTTFYRTFNEACLKLYTLPKPTVAAICGHATAGGCVLTLCCDRRLIAETRKLMGLNEVKLGVPVPYLADGVLRQLVAARNAIEIMEGGEFFPPAEALRLGLVDTVTPEDELLSRAVEQARALGAAPRGAYAQIKGNRQEDLLARYLERCVEKERLFLDLWFADATRERLAEAAKKF